LSWFNDFCRRKPIIGMIHVAALPGTPRQQAALEQTIDQAVVEARVYVAAGVDALLIENMHDVPYLCGRVGPEIVAAMTAIGRELRRATALPLGVQILAAANCEALAVALACGASFVRVENFAYAHVADEGLMPTAAAGPLLRYRRLIGAERIAVVADVKKKHASHALTADVPLAEAAATTAFFGADALVITGRATGQPTDPADVAAARSAVRIPVGVGSGMNSQNLATLWPAADFFIVGSHVKFDGHWANPVDPARLNAFMRAVADLRSSSQPPRQSRPPAKS